MKKKRLIAFLFFTVISITFCGIPVKADEARWDSDSSRSISLFLSIEKNELHICSTNPWNDVNIEILDTTGVIVYMDRIDIPAEEELTVPIADTDLPEGNYQVILTKNSQPVTWYLTK